MNLGRDVSYLFKEFFGGLDFIFILAIFALSLALIHGQEPSKHELKSYSLSACSRQLVEYYHLSFAIPWTQLVFQVQPPDSISP